MTKVSYIYTNAEGKKVVTASYAEAQKHKEYTVQYTEGFNADELKK